MSLPPAAGEFLLDGCRIGFEPGQSVASALLLQGHYVFRHSPRAGNPRGPFCMMGACQECLIHIDGVLRQACLVSAETGMQVESRGVPGA